MQKIIYPTNIMLKELPFEGRDYHYSHESKELSPVLKELIQKNDYKVDLHLRPLGNAFEIAGTIKTKIDLPCSRCGRDTEFPVDDNFREMILVEDQKPRGGHSGHVGSDLVSDGPYCNYISSYHFDIAAFVHEHVAASEPYIVECGRKDCAETVIKAQLNTMAPEHLDEKTNPFAVLKKLKG